MDEVNPIVKTEMSDMNILKNNIKNNAIKYLIAFVIFIVFFIIAKLLRIKYTSDITNSKTKDKIFLDFIGIMLFYVIIIIGLIISLLHVGFSLSTILVCLGSIGLAIALAMQTLITQLISGIFILFFDLFNIDDIVEINGIKGYVKNFTLFKTTIAPLSDVDTIIPNNNFLTNSYINYTKENIIKHSFRVAISANNKIDYDILLSNLKNAIISQSLYCIDKNNVSITIDEIDDSGTKLKVKVPINSKDTLYADIELKKIVRIEMANDNVLLLDNSYFVLDNSPDIKYNYS